MTTSGPFQGVLAQSIHESSNLRPFWRNGENGFESNTFQMIAIDRHFVWEPAI
jgi:hypothetical protein